MGTVDALTAAGISYRQTAPPAAESLPRSLAELDAFIGVRVRAVARADVARTCLDAVVASAHADRATRVAQARAHLAAATDASRG
ncbi:hypothetical protein GII33_20705 [Gordonia pseudamarae]|uniref:hypothetical protein n=1 Tax=Gordonia TaxID=2053 RepID=UPI00199CCEA5|nr:MULTISPECIES: hypothetical protein [Gordonia]MBD0021926.1 hypothetical protein [Gordonia sp. (in: high G+C Gram-positive bacteria)]QHN28032.1 hypothetical protein GII33_20705 [Gordonia pseudamarae]